MFGFLHISKSMVVKRLRVLVLLLTSHSKCSKFNLQCTACFFQFSFFLIKCFYFSAFQALVCQRMNRLFCHPKFLQKYKLGNFMIYKDDKFSLIPEDINKDGPFFLRKPLIFSFSFFPPFSDNVKLEYISEKN